MQATPPTTAERSYHESGFANAAIENAKGVLLQLGGGSAKQPGFLDMIPGGDIDWSHHDLPWPVPDDSVHMLVATNVAHHVTRAGGHFMAWMNEAWRVLRDGGQFAIVTPYGGSPAWLADPLACNPITEATALYFDPEHKSNLWERYLAKPWQAESARYHPVGTVELILRKRPLPPGWDTLRPAVGS